MCTLRYFIVIEGERTKCHCFITGQPNPTIRWLYNCVSLDIVFNKRKYSLQLLSNDKVTLTIEDWSQEAAGEIIIIVENRADLTQCSAVLTVECNWDHSQSYSHAQSCSYIVELRGSRISSWSTYASSSSG
ncbi:unnamed protein product [Rotaria sp. Silwood1]|nr:unnamed protein product [Rotaria sp. Silwood1]CAF3834883.1 unnamed protein product [Rotaria sp. Silwood1]